MINPSTNGWIDKFFMENSSYFTVFESFDDLYFAIQKTGFIYGYTTHLANNSNISLKENSLDEITKIALLNTLYLVYRNIVTTKHSPSNFITETLTFYNQIQLKNGTFLSKLLPKGKKSNQLEKIINSRIQVNTNFINKKFTHTGTNALLFIDVLSFYHFLQYKNISKRYIINLESVCINLALLALKQKENKTKKDTSLINFFSTSLRYTQFTAIDNTTIEKLSVKKYTVLEKLYLLDIVQITLWNDTFLREKEQQFIKKIGDTLELSDTTIAKNAVIINNFISMYRTKIPYLNYGNPIKNFYNQSNATVARLIKRNQKRLFKEISQSKELMFLLAQSTQRELSVSEQKKVKQQLLDICKTIPSLTLFLLPGGGILLPILVKYIPQLLPSSFNENLN